MHCVAYQYTRLNRAWGDNSLRSNVVQLRESTSKHSTEFTHILFVILFLYENETHLIVPQPSHSRQLSISSLGQTRLITHSNQKALPRLQREDLPPPPRLCASRVSSRSQPHLHPGIRTAQPWDCSPSRGRGSGASAEEAGLSRRYEELLWCWIRRQVLPGGDVLCRCRGCGSRWYRVLS